MKYIIALLAITFYSCKDCDSVVDSYNDAKELRNIKLMQADSLLSIQSGIDSVDNENIDVFLEINDEVNILLIDATLIDIQMEEYKKQNFDCLHDY